MKGKKGWRGRGAVSAEHAINILDGRHSGRAGGGKGPCVGMAGGFRGEF
jgi:hypothetical protein